MPWVQPIPDIARYGSALAAESHMPEAGGDQANAAEQADDQAHQQMRLKDEQMVKSKYDALLVIPMKVAQKP